MFQKLKMIHWLSFFMLLGWFGQMSHAIRVSGLYEATVLVRDQGTSERARGIKAGFEEVLIKVSGNRWAKSNPVLAQALTEADRYLFEFSYTSNKRLVMDSNGNRLEARELKLHFDNKSIDQLIRQAGLPVWGSNRPGILLWIAVETKNGRKILSAEDKHPAIDALKISAQRRGLPLLLPAMDIEDKSALPVASVWQMDQNSIRQASQRYQASAILAGRIYPTSSPNLYTGQWLFLSDNDARQFTSDPGMMAKYVNQGVDQVADMLAKIYAVGSANNTSVAGNTGAPDVGGGFQGGKGITLQVNGVSSVEGYATISEYLSSLSAVKSANVSHIQGNTLWFSIDSDGSLQQLQRIIGLNKRLVADRQPIVGEGGDTLLYYRWQ